MQVSRYLKCGRINQVSRYLEHIFYFYDDLGAAIEKLKFYTIRYSYINYLSNRHSNVRLKSGRAYVGVVFTMGNFNYFAPLCSPKKKSKSWTNAKKDIYLIDNGKLGFLDFANMIPIHPSNLFPMDFSKLEQKYSRLLQKQYIQVNKNSSVILNKARRVYKLRKENNPGFKYCIDFTSIEKTYSEWNENKPYT